MAWCKAGGAHFMPQLARNTRLTVEICGEMGTARRLCTPSRSPTRQFRDVAWCIRESWRRSRRQVGKSEWLVPAGSIPRFIVTSQPTERVGAREPFETR